MAIEGGVVEGAEPIFEKIKVGDEISLIKGPVTRDGIQAYGKASGDRNPIHMNEKAAIASGLGDVIAHGLSSMAYVNQLLGNWAGESGWVRKIDIQMRGMVRIDDILTSKGKITKKYEDGGKKFVELDVWQESKTIVTEEKEKKRFFKEKDEFVTVGDKKYRIQKTIIGSGIVILP